MYSFENPDIDELNRIEQHDSLIMIQGFEQTLLDSLIVIKNLIAKLSDNSKDTQKQIEPTKLKPFDPEDNRRQ